MDANKPKSVYSSHSVRQNGVVVCPTLLSQECKYCHKKGHTVKFCSTLEKDKKKKPEDKKIEVKNKQTVQTPVNMFSVLDDQDECEDVEEIVIQKTNVIAAALNGIAYIKEEYPALSANVIAPALSGIAPSLSANVIAPALSGIAPALGGYAAALKTQPKIEVKTQPIKTPQLAKIQNQESSAYRFKYDPNQKKSWANCSDSEDEDEEEQIESNCAW